jgi:hypothetical protein
MQVPPSFSEFHERYYFIPRVPQTDFYCYEGMPEEYELEPPSDSQESNSDISDSEMTDDDSHQENQRLQKRTREK